MGSSGDKKTNKLLEQQRNQQSAEHTQDRALVNSRSDDAYGRQNQMYDSMFGGLDDFIKTGGVSDADRERMRGLMGSRAGSGGGGGGGGYSPNPIDINALGMNEMEGLYRDSITGKSIDKNALRIGNPTLTGLMNSGGYDPEFLKSLGDNVGMLKAIGMTGGVSPEAQARMRGGGVFDEYAATGGIGRREEDVLRNRGNSQISSIFDRTRDNIGRQSRITGSNAGSAAMMTKLARDQARSAGDMALNTEMGIIDRRDDGRRWGATSMSGAEGQLQGLISNNQLNALNSANSTERGIQEFMSNTKGSSAKDLAAIESGIQDKTTDERRYGMAGLETIIKERIAEAQRAEAARASAYESQRAAEEASWRDQLGLEKYMFEAGREGKQYGIEGMMGLYGSTPAESAMYNDMRLQERGLTGQQQNQNIAGQFNNRGQSFREFLGNAAMTYGPAAIGAFTGNPAAAAGGLKPRTEFVTR